MLAARVARRWKRDDDVGADHANQPHVVGGDLVAAPLLERFFDAERVAEIDRAREVLVRAVEPVQRRQLLRSQHAERLEDFRSDFVLAAVAARRRRERGAIALTAIEHDQQPIVLVVGMRRRVHEDADVRQMPQSEPERDVALLFVERDDAHLADWHDRKGREGDKRRQKKAFHHSDLTGWMGRRGRTGWMGGGKERPKDDRSRPSCPSRLSSLAQNRNRKPSWNFRCSYPDGFGNRYGSFGMSAAVFPCASTTCVVVIPASCCVLKTFFSSAMTSARTDPRSGIQRVYRRSTFFRIGR